jgi:hemoglobin/transferrin/lactoferrin receptor protein
MGLVANRVAVLLGGAAVSVFVAGSIAQAQQTTGEKQGRVTLLQRLVVGAGEDKVAIDTPQAVSVVEQEDIDREQASTISEIVETIPGVNAAGSSRPMGQSFNIRGIGGSETAGEEGRIIINVDGVNKFYEQYRMGGFFSDPELYKKVEVLRGPASSTLYGSGALGGVVNFVTKDGSDFIAPDQSGALRLKSGYNSNKNGWLGSVILAQRFGEDFDFLLAGNYRRADAYQSGDGTTVQGTEFQGWSGLAKGTWKVGDEGRMKLSYQHWDSDADDQDYVQIGGLAAGGSTSGFGTVDRHVVDKTAILSYENPFTDNNLLNLEARMSFSDTTVEQRNASGVPGGVFGPFPLTCASSDTFCDADYGYQTWQFNLENTSEWRGESWENYLTYGWQATHQTRTGQYLTAAGTPMPFDYHPAGTDFKNAFFIQNEFIWDERLTLIPGIRVEHRTLTPDASTGLTMPTSDWAYSPKIAAHYKFNETFAVFGSIAHTERFPTLDEVFSTAFAASYNLRPEKSNNFEAGFAISRFDVFQPGDGFQFKATGFYNDITDLIISCTPASNPCGMGYTSQYMNINQAAIYGAELEMAYETEHFFASAAYTHLMGRNTRTNTYLTTVAPHELAITVGGRLPQHGVSFGLRSRFVAEPQDPAVRLSTSPSAFASQRYARAFNVHDVFLTWAPPEDSNLRGWRADVGVDNIFNTQYKEFLKNEPAKGRTFKVSLSKQIGW